MGNLTYLIPSRVPDAVTVDDVAKMISVRFPQAKIEKNDEFTMLDVRREKDGELICSIYFDKCKLVSPEYLDDQIRTTRQEEGDDAYIGDFEEIRALQLADVPALSLTYPGDAELFKEREAITRHLKGIFEAYVFDEGVYPEFYK